MTATVTTRSTRSGRLTAAAKREMAAITANREAKAQAMRDWVASQYEAKGPIVTARPGKRVTWTGQEDARLLRRGPKAFFQSPGNKRRSLSACYNRHAFLVKEMADAQAA